MIFSAMAAYEIVLLWSGLCGIVACFIAWKLWRKKPERNKSIQFSRQAILEATNKRILEQNRELKDENIEGPKSSVPERESERDGELGSVSSRNQRPHVKEQNKTEKTQKFQNKIIMTPIDQIKKSFHVKIKADPSGRFDGGLDPDTQLPICQPLKSVDAVFCWIPGFDHFSIANIPLKSVSREFPKRPKTLVCHDMRGGYTEDRFIQGFNSTTCYRINHWNFIDTFVYFSHNIVTIPPPCWTNSCHRHGVKVLGTFITEWDDGEKYCANILKTKESYERFAKQLVEIACYYNFDGWLINIENKIQAGMIESLVKFLEFLTNSMHAAKQESEIVWYDSVTNQGSLEWQNELNSKNRMFFDVCDGIFLNYTWSVHNLSRSALVAGNDRKFDVYVGVDCFGRGCFGGGGWNTYKAMQVIRDQNLSAAIFAPGWVLETQGEKDFTKHQNKFWHLLMSYLYPHVVIEIPIVSSFCQGYGEHYFSNGKNLMNLPWTNLSCQQLQPTFYDEYYQLGSQNALQVKDMTYFIDDAYEGGGCIKVNGIVNTKDHSSRTFLRLFRCSCKMPKNIFASFTFKIDQFQTIDIFLLLLLDGKPNYIVLAPSEPTGAVETTKECYVNLGNEKFATSKQMESSSYSIPDNQKENYKVFQPLVGETKDRIIQLSRNGEENSNKWISRYYLISDDQLPDLKEIRVVCATKSSGQPRVQPFTLLLGEIKVIAAEDMVQSFPIITNIRCRDTTITKSSEHTVLSTTILWDSLHQQTRSSLFVCYDIYCAGVEVDGYENTEIGVFLGKAFVESYRIANLKVPNECQESLKIYIQAKDEDNMKVGLQHCGILTLEW